MLERLGVILVGKEEVLAGIFGVDSLHKVHSLFITQKPVVVERPEDSFSMEVVELVTELMWKGSDYKVSEWRIVAKNVSVEVVQSVSMATGLTIELIPPQREKELLMQGVVGEMR